MMNSPTDDQKTDFPTPNDPITIAFHKQPPTTRDITHIQHAHQNQDDNYLGQISTINGTDLKATLAEKDPHPAQTAQERRVEHEDIFNIITKPQYQRIDPVGQALRQQQRIEEDKLQQQQEIIDDDHYIEQTRSQLPPHQQEQQQIEESL